MKIKYKDKIKHFAVSFFITLIIYYLAKDILVAIFGTLAIGLAKEANDQIKKKNSIKEFADDMSANMVGILLALYIIKIL